jgi:mono/diheme cytochrome c family protein
MQTGGKFWARRKSFMGAIFTFVATLGIAGSAGADDAQDIRAGKELAVRVCAPCQVVTSQPPQGQTPRPSAPSFEEIAKGTKAAPEPLRIFLLSTQSSVAHPGSMPNPKLTEDQIRVIAAYLSTLRNAKQ